MSSNIILPAVTNTIKALAKVEAPNKSIAAVVEKLAVKGADEFVASTPLKDAAGIMKEKHANARKIMLNALNKLFQNQENEAFIKNFNIAKEIAFPVFNDTKSISIKHLPEEHQDFIRSFAHDLGNFGNYCTLLYAKLQDIITEGKSVEEVKKVLLKDCNNVFKKINEDFQTCNLFLSNKITDFASSFNCAETSALEIFKGKKITFTVENKELLSRVNNKNASDCSSFFHVYRTLLENAGKYTPEGGEVKITFKEGISKNGETGLISTIRDSGIGVEKEDLSKIFFPGSRGRNTKNISGTGFGLDNVKKNAQNLHGNINISWSETVGPKTGTEFEVFLPVELKAKTPPQTTLSQSTTNPIKGFSTLA